METGEQTKTTLRKIIATFCAVFLFCFVNIYAQRIEAHLIKDLSPNENANKAWGGGGTIELDQLVKNISFKAYFDWTIYKEKNSNTKTNYQRMGGGVAACYSLTFAEKGKFQCGVEINYTHLKHTYIYGYSTVDSTVFYPLTTLQTGGFIGIGPHIGLQYKLAPRLNVVLNVVPTYLILVRNKSSVEALKPEYDKGIWLFPIRLGFSYQLFNKD